MLKSITFKQALKLQPTLDDRNDHDYGIPLDHPAVTFMVDGIGVLIINVPKIGDVHSRERTYLFDGRLDDAWRCI